MQKRYQIDKQRAVQQFRRMLPRENEQRGLPHRATERDH
jgi:hypothetical protein